MKKSTQSIVALHKMIDYFDYCRSVSIEPNEDRFLEIINNSKSELEEKKELLISIQAEIQSILNKSGIIGYIDMCDLSKLQEYWCEEIKLNKQLKDKTIKPTQDELLTKLDSAFTFFK